jgi:hypothetical protein
LPQTPFSASANRALTLAAQIIMLLCRQEGKSRDVAQAIREDSTRKVSRVTSRILSQLVAVVTAVALLDFVSYLIATSYLGGDAVNGKIEGGRYYLWGLYHGTKTYHEVSQAVFTFSRLHTYSLFILWPLMFALIVASKRVARRREF